MAWYPPCDGTRFVRLCLEGCSSAPLAFLFWCAGSSRSPELLRCLRNFLGSGGPVQFGTLPGLSLWFFRTCLGFRGTPPDIRVALSDFRMRSSSSSLPRLGVLGDSMLCLFLARFPVARLWCPLLSSRILWRKFRPPPLLLGLRALLYRPNQR